MHCLWFSAVASAIGKFICWSGRSCSAIYTCLKMVWMAMIHRLHFNGRICISFSPTVINHNRLVIGFPFNCYYLRPLSEGEFPGIWWCKHAQSTTWNPFVQSADDQECTWGHTNCAWCKVLPPYILLEFTWLTVWMHYAQSLHKCKYTPDHFH